MSDKTWERFLALMKTLSPILMTVVAAIAAYWGVDRHAQGLAEREQALEERRATHEIRTTYLGKAIESETEFVRVRYLRYLAATERDAGFRAWAQSELTQAEAELEEVTRQLEEAVARYQEANDARLQAELEIQDAQRRQAEAEARVRELEAEAAESDDELVAELAEAQRSLEESNQAVAQAENNSADRQRAVYQASRDVSRLAPFSYLCVVGAEGAEARDVGSVGAWLESEAAALCESTYAECVGRGCTPRPISTYTPAGYPWAAPKAPASLGIGGIR